MTTETGENWRVGDVVVDSQGMRLFLLGKHDGLWRARYDAGGTCFITKPELYKKWLPK